MTWILSVCLCITAGACNVSCRQYLFQSKEDCDAARKTLPQFEAGYAICSLEPKK
jgi:hypothetical protein